MFGSDLGVWATIWSSGAMTICIAVGFALIVAGMITLLFRPFESGLGIGAMVIGVITVLAIFSSVPFFKYDNLTDGLTTKIEEKYDFSVASIYDNYPSTGQKRRIFIKEDHVDGFVQGRARLDDGEWFDTTYKFSYESDGDVNLHIVEKGKNGSVTPEELLK